MIQPDAIDDATLEYAARQIEETNLSDLRGVGAKRKRDREDANLRFQVRKELRAELAAHLRAMMNRPELSAISTLSWLATLKPEDKYGHIHYLKDAWPLAWKGWLNVIAELCCNSNSIPPEISYRIELTEKGRKVLENAIAREAAPPGAP